MTETADVLIIGGGVMGASIAYQLAKQHSGRKRHEGIHIMKKLHGRLRSRDIFPIIAGFCLQLKFNISNALGNCIDTGKHPPVI